MKKNSGCLIAILILLAIAGVGWVRYYVIPVFVILLVISVFKKKKTYRDKNGQECKTEGRTGERQEYYQNGEGQEKEPEDRSRQEQNGYGSTEYNMDSIITCEYCGSRIDTNKYNTCPHCGGSYWDNEQWQMIWRKKNSF